MLQATILPLKPAVREGVSKRDGKPYRMVTQVAVIDLGAGPESVNLRVRQDKDGRDLLLAPGEYQLDKGSFYLMDGEISFSPKWVAVKKNA